MTFRFDIWWICEWNMSMSTMHMSGWRNEMDQLELFISLIVVQTKCIKDVVIIIFKTHLFDNFYNWLSILSHSCDICIKFGPIWPHEKMLIFDKWRHLLFLCNTHSVHLGFRIVTFFMKRNIGKYEK